MDFEQFRRQIEEEAQKASLKAAKEKEERDAKFRQAKEDARAELEIHQQEHSKAGSFYEESGIGEKIEELKRLIFRQNGFRYISESIYMGEVPIGMYGLYVNGGIRNPDSILKLVAWEKVEPGGYGQLENISGSGAIVVETMPNGVIAVRGNEIEETASISEIRIGPFMFREGRVGRKGVSGSTSIVEHQWRDNPHVLEDALLKAYLCPMPIHRKWEPSPMGE